MLPYYPHLDDSTFFYSRSDFLQNLTSDFASVASYVLEGSTRQSILARLTGGAQTEGLFKQLNSTLLSFIERWSELGAEQTSVDSHGGLIATVAAIVFALFLFIARMSWASRLGNLGRFSPFARSPPSKTEVSDSDFSYITNDDLRKHQREQQQAQEENADLGPARETDKVIVKNKRDAYAIHFPAYTIAKGDLIVRDIREAIAKKVGQDPKRIKLLYKGKNLKDDNATCRSYGLKDGSEMMCIIGETLSPSDSDGSSSDEDIVDGSGEQNETRKKKRNRNKSRKKRDKRRDQRESGASSPSPYLQPPQSSTSTRTPSPARTPQTALEKIRALRESLQNFVPQCEAFKSNPPQDPAKKDFEHKRLSETILTQVLLKLDAVETEGDDDARAKRKELVKETQAMLKEIDEVMKH